MLPISETHKSLLLYFLHSFCKFLKKNGTLWNHYSATLKDSLRQLQGWEWSTPSGAWIFTVDTNCITKEYFKRLDSWRKILGNEKDIVTSLIFPQAHTSVARSYSHILLAAVLEGTWCNYGFTFAPATELPKHMEVGEDSLVTLTSGGQPKW